MAKIAGVDVLLYVKDEAGVPIPLAGQTGTELELSADTIDVTDKNSNGWKTAMAGLKSWSMSSDGFVDLGDYSLTILRQAFLRRQPISVNIKLGGKSGDDGVLFYGAAYITSLPHSFNQDDAVTYSVDLEGASELMIAEGMGEFEMDDVVHGENPENFPETYPSLDAILEDYSRAASRTAKDTED